MMGLLKIFRKSTTTRSFEKVHEVRMQFTARREALEDYLNTEGVDRAGIYLVVGDLSAQLFEVIVPIPDYTIAVVG